MKRTIAWSLAVVASLACAPPAASQTPEPGSVDQQQVLLVPPGHGTLRQDEVTVQLRSGPLLVKVTPLAEVVTRLTAPDTYQKLHSLAESRREEAARAAGGREADLFLVSFFSYEPDVVFQPEDLQLATQGRLLRPLGILPVTPGWGRQRLAQQETQMAIYVFPADLDYALPITVQYGFERTDDWNGILNRLEIERGKVRARAGS